VKPAAFRFLMILSALALLGASTALARELTFEVVRRCGSLRKRIFTPAR
jgi:hypothetical protein